LEPTAKRAVARHDALSLGDDRDLGTTLDPSDARPATEGQRRSKPINLLAAELRWVKEELGDLKTLIVRQARDRALEVDVLSNRFDDAVLSSAYQCSGGDATREQVGCLGWQDSLGGNVADARGGVHIDEDSLVFKLTSDDVSCAASHAIAATHESSSQTVGEVPEEHPLFSTAGWRDTISIIHDKACAAAFEMLGVRTRVAELNDLFLRACAASPGEDAAMGAACAPVCLYPDVAVHELSYLLRVRQDLMGLGDSFAPKVVVGVKSCDELMELFDDACVAVVPDDTLCKAELSTPQYMSSNDLDAVLSHLALMRRVTTDMVGGALLVTTREQGVASCVGAGHPGVAPPSSHVLLHTNEPEPKRESWAGLTEVDPEVKALDLALKEERGAICRALSVTDDVLDCAAPAAAGLDFSVTRLRHCRKCLMEYGKYGTSAALDAEYRDCRRVAIEFLEIKDDVPAVTSDFYLVKRLKKHTRGLDGARW